MIPSKWIEVTEAIGFVSNTIGAVTGGLAGILWDVPKKRTDKLKNVLKNVCFDLNKS